MGKVDLPLVQSAHTASPSDELTAERVAEVLLEDEASRAGTAPSRSVVAKDVGERHEQARPGRSAPGPLPHGDRTQK